MVAINIWQGRAAVLLRDSEEGYLNGTATIADVARACCDHATASVRAWWDLSDELLRDFAYPAATYPAWWLQATDYVDGPPPSPEVPPPPTR